MKNNTLSNYRPVLLLSQFSKILEKIFSTRLENFTAKHNILCDQQYGFRANGTNSHALIQFLEEITTAIEQKKYAVGILLDLKKAFDTVDHNFLIMKLHKYGIRGTALSWLNSYLHNRQQYVELQNHNSKFKKITCGLPQGSVLGPLLFNLYINNVSEVSKTLKTFYLLMILI